MLQQSASLEGPAFFFFFAAFSSPDFESEAFRAFCAACYRLRTKRPTLTVGALHALIVVAAAKEPLTYESFAAHTGQSYNSAAIQAAQLAEGRGRSPGLRLLKRVSGKDRRQTLLVASRLGAAVAHIFSNISTLATPKAPREAQGTTETNEPYLEVCILPALRKLKQEAPDLTLGTLCVLLFAIENADRFGHHGEPASIIGRHLGISNLTKHFEYLSNGSKVRPGLGLLEMRRYDRNKRLVHPVATGKGLKLVASVAAILSQNDPSAFRRPKRESLASATTPDAVAEFSEEDFEILDFNNAASADDAGKSGLSPKG